MKTIEECIEKIDKKSNIIIVLISAIVIFNIWLIILIMQSPYTY